MTALVRYDAACRALAEARLVDEVKEIRDQAVAMAVYARQAKNRDLESDAVEIRMRATRRLDRLRQAQKETVGLAKGGKPYTGLRKNPVKPTLADAGIDKNLAHEGRKLSALSDEQFEQKVAEARDATTRAVRTIIKSITIEHKQPTDGGEVVMLRTHDGREFPYPNPRGSPTFNQTNEQVSWAAWTWNPVTGCLHNCPYCYARELAETNPNLKQLYPVGFTPLFHHERLDAPANTKVPEKTTQDSPLGRVFVVSMGDLFGKWVPDEWIAKVFASCIANPQWEYLFLTKFPQRYVGLRLPPTAWIGTTVDEQYRVKIAEEAYRKIEGVRVKMAVARAAACTTRIFRSVDVRLGRDRLAECDQAATASRSRRAVCATVPMGSSHYRASGQMWRAGLLQAESAWRH